MLDLLPKEMWAVDPSPTFLEPACGDGNFLVAILERKLASVESLATKGKLAAGKGDDALAFHSLQALASIYGVDISEDNVIGGVPEHPIGARTRMENALVEFIEGQTGRSLRTDSKILQSARWIAERNIQIANMLESHADGSPTYRDDLPLTVYAWEPSELRVSISRTTLGDVAAVARQATDAEMSLFGPAEPETLWSGPFNELHRAAVDPSRDKDLKAAA